MRAGSFASVVLGVLVALGAIGLYNWTWNDSTPEAVVGVEDSEAYDVADSETELASEQRTSRTEVAAADEAQPSITPEEVEQAPEDEQEEPPQDLDPSIEVTQTPWSEAKMEMQADFEPSKTDLEWFREEAYLMEVPIPGSESMVKLDLRQDPEELAAVLASYVGEERGSTVALESAVAALISSERGSIETEAVNAESLYVESMLLYWESEKYTRWRYGERPGTDGQVYDLNRPEGRYGIAFTAVGGGWRASVDFDSSDFPIFEQSLEGLDHSKEQLAGKVAALLGEG
ncbi:hypothetical protein Pla163_10860 [Planctomycetes bacterium Pla163]|uniref:Uncharacterized protein n=1 Tax=Rohdeia mirabilis TaxID=2528008 RepID=A0A518CXN4_9BACT|nr:hypothetical protein Pla163_10860 [Planctomycetes bacterium Pla163]